MQFVMKWRGKGFSVLLVAGFAAGLGGCGGQEQGEPDPGLPETGPVTTETGASSPAAYAPPGNTPSQSAKAATSDVGAIFSGDYLLTDGPGEVDSVLLRVSEDGTFELTSPEKDHKATGAWKLENGLAAFDGRVEEENRTVRMKLKPMKDGLELVSVLENGVSEPLAGSSKFIFKKQ